MKTILEEFRALARLVRENFQEWLVLSLAALFIILNKKHPLDERWMGHALYYFILPVASIALLLRKNPLDFGLRLGNWRLWIKFVGLSLVIIIPVLVFASRAPSVRNYYAASAESTGHYIATMGMLLFAWEFLFRGFLLFGLKEKFGEAAIFIQMVPFAIMHLGKPEIEALSTVITGTLFGFIALRGGSFWPAFIIHLVLNVGNRVVMDLLH